MKQKVALFDCDDVLADLRTPLQDIVSTFVGRPVSYNEWYQYNIGSVYGMEFKPICDEIVHQNILPKLKPDIHAKQVVEDYKMKGYKTMILTSRGYHPDGKELTEQWCKDNNLPIDEVICIPLGVKKQNYVLQIPNVEIYVEDNHEHAQDASLFVDNVFLINRPWNTENTRAIRIDYLWQIPYTHSLNQTYRNIG